MKYLFLSLLSILTLSLSAQKTAPDVVIHDLKGEPVNIQDYANNGKITVLSFWATWCSPCKKELDAIADLYPAWQKDFGAELLAITIDTERDLRKVPPILAKKSWDWDVLSDKNQELQNALGFQTVPHTIILDQDGKIVYDHSGYVPGDEYEIEKLLKELAKK